MAQREVPMVGCGGKGASTNGDDAPDRAPCDAADEARLRPGPGPRIVESVIAESGHIFIGTAGNLG